MIRVKISQAGQCCISPKDNRFLGSQVSNGTCPDAEYNFKLAGSKCTFNFELQIVFKSIESQSIRYFLDKILGYKKTSFALYMKPY